MLALSTATTTWLLSVVAALLSAVATNLLSRAGERRRLAAEDERRWLKDRQALYARYLGLVEHLEREADSIACFLPHDEQAPPMAEEDELLVREMFQEWMERWDEEIQPTLSEIELLASTEVADLAARAAQGILEAVPQPQYLGPDKSRIVPSSYREHWPTQQMAQGLRRRLRDAMRVELGLNLFGDQSPSDPNWPWLAEEPTFADHQRRMAPYLWPESAPARGDSDDPSGDDPRP